MTRIRPARAGDVPWLARLANLPAIEGALSIAAARTPAELGAQVQAGERWILLGPDGEPAGTAGLRIMNRRSRIANVYGLAVDPAGQGRGTARAALAALVAHALDELGVHRVELEAYGYNDAAVALFRAMGFVEEGARRRAWLREGEWHDGVRFAALAEDPRPA
jgi:RimJ/RimL family protein N-acetyltransferase